MHKCDDRNISTSKIKNVSPGPVPELNKICIGLRLVKYYCTLRKTRPKQGGPVEKGKWKSKTQVTSYELKSLSYDFKSTSYEFKSTSSSLWVASSNLRIASSNPRVSGLQGQPARLKA